MNTTGMTNLMTRMHIVLPQTIYPHMVCPSNIVTYLKTQRFYNQLQDTVVRQFDPPHRRYPQTDFRFAPDENLDSCCLGYGTIIWLPDFLRKLMAPSFLISWRMRQQLLRKVDTHLRS